jgi:hypothetical protein
LFVLNQGVNQGNPMIQLTATRREMYYRKT